MRLHPPTCVGLRYGLHELNLEAFLGSGDSTTSGIRHGIAFQPYRGRIYLSLKPTCLHPHPTVRWPILLRPSIAHSYKYGNINPFPISYAFQPRLRGRLTLGRLPLPRKPWVYGERVFHPFYRYSCQHDHFSTVHHTLTRQLLPVENAPLPSSIRYSRSFGTILSLDTFSARDH